MELVVDVYNRLKTRDVIVTCPGCGRMLYVPEDLTPEMAVRQKKKTAKRATRKKTTKKAPARKDRKGVPADVKRILTTAAAESMRSAHTEGEATVDVEVRVSGVDDAVGPLSVASRDAYAKLVAGKMQAADLEVELEVVEVGDDGVAVIDPDLSPDGAAGNPNDDVSDRVPSQPTVLPDAEPVSAG